MLESDSDLHRQTMDSGGELQIDQNEAYRTENVDDTFLSVEHALLSGSCEDG